MGRFSRAGATVGALVLTASLALTGCGGGDEGKKPAFEPGQQQVGGTRRPHGPVPPRHQAGRVRWNVMGASRPV